MTNIEIFIELNNQIYWIGYAQALAKSDPSKFNYEYTEFLNHYHF